MKVGDMVLSDNMFINIIEYIHEDGIYDGVCIFDFVNVSSTPYLCCNTVEESKKIDQELISILYGLEE